MDLFGVDARDTADQFTNLAQGRASITSALELLNTGKSQSYDKALGKLGGEIRERWSQAIRPKPVGLPDFSKPDFSESAEGLLQFLERAILPNYERRCRELENLPMIRQQVIGETLEPDRLDGLCRYELHLDRKLERMLSMLIRLQDLRRVSAANST